MDAPLPLGIGATYLGSMRLGSRVAITLTGGLLVVAAACGGGISEPPVAPKVIQSPLVGQWMLTTTMDTFTFETAGPYVPDCMNSNPYCLHYRTTVDGAYLGGVLTVKDSFGLKGIVAPSVQASGTLTRAFCDSIDYKNLTGCTHVGPQVAILYMGRIDGVPDTTMAGSINFSVGEPDDGSGFYLDARSFIRLTYAGDSLYGRFRWGMSAGRNPPTYTGSIVLRRVK